MHVLHHSSSGSALRRLHPRPAGPYEAVLELQELEKWSEQVGSSSAPPTYRYCSSLLVHMTHCSSKYPRLTLEKGSDKIFIKEICTYALVKVQSISVVHTYKNVKKGIITCLRITVHSTNPYLARIFQNGLVGRATIVLITAGSLLFSHLTLEDTRLLKEITNLQK